MGRALFLTYDYIAESTQPNNKVTMLDFLLSYSATFLIHACIGGVLVLAASWGLYRVARKFNWHIQGERGPRYVASINRFFAVLILIFVAGITGFQAGAVMALAETLEDTVTESTLKILINIGTPIGIRDPDQLLTMDHTRQLLDRWTPQPLLQQPAKNIFDHAWFGNALGYWRHFPASLKTIIRANSLASPISLRTIVNKAWHTGLSPLLKEAKRQALFFAYGLAAAMVILTAAFEWSWLAFTRSKKQMNRPE